MKIWSHRVEHFTLSDCILLLLYVYCPLEIKNTLSAGGHYSGTSNLMDETYVFDLLMIFHEQNIMLVWNFEEFDIQANQSFILIFTP